MQSIEPFFFGTSCQCVDMKFILVRREERDEMPADELGRTTSVYQCISDRHSSVNIRHCRMCARAERTVDLEGFPSIKERVI